MNLMNYLWARKMGGSSGSSGGGSDSGGASQLDALLDRTITEVTSNALQVPDGAFAYCTALTSAIFPKATLLKAKAFQGCILLATVAFPLVEQANEYALSGCAMSAVSFPKLGAIADRVLQSCQNLIVADFSSAQRISSYALYNCKKLVALILRTETMATLSATNSFQSTPIASGTGYIYVPAALVDTYKAATNWSTYADQFRALEDYTVDGTITGELDESKI